MTIEISEDEYERLLIVLGYAAGAALKDPDARNVRMVLECVNKVGARSPTFYPYAIPEAVPSA